MRYLHERPALLDSKILELQIKAFGLAVGRKPPQLPFAIGGQFQLGIVKGRPVTMAYPMPSAQRFDKCQRNLPDVEFSYYVNKRRA